MLRTAATSLSQSQSSSSVYNYKTLHDIAIRPVVNVRASPHTSESKRSPSSKSSSSQMFVDPSLDDLLIRGQWKFRATHDDRLQFKARGIENLVYTCYDIMYQTREAITRKQATSNLSVVVQLDQYRRLTEAERTALSREHVFQLMTIVYDAASTRSSVSELIRIWREATPRLPRSATHPKISHELAVRHLLQTPDNPLLQVALHASLIAGRSRMDLQEFGEKLGIRRHQFDMGSIKDSTRAFTEFLKFVREQKGKSDREQQAVNIQKLPYKPRKKRGLNANVFGTKFSVGEHCQGFRC